MLSNRRGIGKICITESQPIEIVLAASGHCTTIVRDLIIAVKRHVDNFRRGSREVVGKFTWEGAGNLLKISNVLPNWVHLTLYMQNHKILPLLPYLPTPYEEPSAWMMTVLL